MKNILTLFLILCLKGSTIQAQQTTYLFISPNGKDTNCGTKDSPFATLQGVFDRIKTKPRNAYESLTVLIEDGNYNVGSIDISPSVNGAMDTKIVIKAKNQGKVIFNAGKKVNLKEFTRVKGDFKSRVQQHLADSVFSIKISDLGIRNIRQYADIFDGNGGLIQLFFNDKRMPLSEYPNKGEPKMTIKEVLINGGGQEKPGDWSAFYKDNEVRRKLEINPPRPGVFTYRQEHLAAHKRWSKAIANGVPIWVNGFWRVMWENSTIRVADIDTEKSKVKLAVPLKNGIGSKYDRPGGSGQEVYKVVNLLEEVDKPGEWSFDFESQQLFFYPPKQTGSVTIAHQLSPILNIRYASNITIEGIVFEGGLGNGIQITGGRDNKVLGCTIQKIGNDGVVIKGGFSHEVRSCNLSDLGGGGIWLSGGMEETTPRVASNHKIINNYIHHFAEVRRVYAAGINCGFSGGGGGGHYPAVGNLIAHNLIHSTPHVGILHGSMDNVFEYNEVYDWSNVSNDMGAIYCYSHYPYIENTTVRYNFFHSSAQGDGIYFDHNMKDAKVYGNIVFNLGSDDEHGRGTAFLIKNGNKDKDKDRIKVFNNISINAKYGYYAKLANNQDFYSNIAINTKERDFELYFHKDSQDEFIENPKAILSKNKSYKKRNNDFVDFENLNFNLKSTSRIFKKFPNFKPIPFHKIGLYIDEYRKEVNNKHRNMKYLQQFTKGVDAYTVEDRD